MNAQQNQTPRRAALPLGPGAPAGWRAEAARAHEQRAPDPAAWLRGTLGAAVRALTGATVDPATIVVDPERGAALAALDGVRFRLDAAQLTIIRPCAHCGHGELASPPIASRRDLDFAMGGWRPLHADCRPFEPDDIH